MSIIRRKVNRNFTIVPNEPVNDERLSFDALGLLTYLLSRPDDWTVKPDQLRARGGNGRDKIRTVVNCLIEAGYIVRRKVRDRHTKKYVADEYLVYDEPQNVEGREPAPENPSVELTSRPGPEKPAPENPSPILSTDNTNSVSKDTGANAPPTVSKMIWDEALALISPHSKQPEKNIRNLIGKWNARASSTDDKDNLLSIIRAATVAGTYDPVSYIAKAVNETWPPPPDPANFDADKWRGIISIAIERGAWPESLGPPPGKKGCKVPRELITPELIEATNTKGKVG